MLYFAMTLSILQAGCKSEIEKTSQEIFQKKVQEDVSKISQNYTREAWQIINESAQEQEKISPKET